MANRAVSRFLALQPLLYKPPSISVHLPPIRCRRRTLLTPPVAEAAESARCRDLGGSVRRGSARRMPPGRAAGGPHQVVDLGIQVLDARVANTTGVVAEGVAPWPASNSTATLFTGATYQRLATPRSVERVVITGAARLASRREPDDRGVEVPHLVGSGRSKAHFGFAGCTRSRGRRQPSFRTRRYQLDGEAQTARRCAWTASVPVGTCRYLGAVTMSSMPGPRLGSVDGATCADRSTERQRTRVLHAVARP